MCLYDPLEQDTEESLLHLTSPGGYIQLDRMELFEECLGNAVMVEDTWLERIQLKIGHR